MFLLIMVLLTLTAHNSTMVLPKTWSHLVNQKQPLNHNNLISKTRVQQNNKHVLNISTNSNMLHFYQSDLDVHFKLVETDTKTTNGKRTISHALTTCQIEVLMYSVQCTFIGFMYKNCQVVSSVTFTG